MARFALSTLENAGNTEKVQSIARVIKASSQVMTFLNFEIVP